MRHVIILRLVDSVPLYSPPQALPSFGTLLEEAVGAGFSGFTRNGNKQKTGKKSRGLELLTRIHKYQVSSFLQLYSLFSEKGYFRSLRTI